MPDKKPIDAEIKKALECCLEASGVNCGKCPYCDNCVTDENTSLMMIDVLDLLNRLQADRENYKQIAENQQKIILDKAFENKRLRTSNDALRMANELCKGWEERAKAEAYKEFAERLKQLKYQSSDWSHGEHPFVVEESDIDDTLYELVGEDND
ncbi:MAG: hypothetical protein U0M06_12720 [Clostridia bacterium]|nr:hypothetical protein [Clostridia bacterium]